MVSRSAIEVGEVGNVMLKQQPKDPAEYQYTVQRAGTGEFNQGTKEPRDLCGTSLLVIPGTDAAAKGVLLSLEIRLKKYSSADPTGLLMRYRRAFIIGLASASIVHGRSSTACASGEKLRRTYYSPTTGGLRGTHLQVQFSTMLVPLCGQTG